MFRWGKKVDDAKSKSSQVCPWFAHHLRVEKGHEFGIGLLVPHPAGSGLLRWPKTVRRRSDKMGMHGSKRIYRRTSLMGVLTKRYAMLFQRECEE